MLRGKLSYLFKGISYFIGAKYRYIFKYITMVKKIYLFNLWVSSAKKAANLSRNSR